jgi:hypothetical protein
MNEEPDQITIGETTTWSKTSSEYPATDYSLKYTFNGSGGAKTITAEASGANYLVTISAAGITSLVTLKPGTYTLLGWFEKGAGDNIERYTFLKKTITLLANLFSGSAAEEGSIARQTLALIQVAIKAYAKRPMDSITIGGKMITRPTLDVLTRFEREYNRRVADEFTVEKRAQGKVTSRMIKTEFTTPM